MQNLKGKTALVTGGGRGLGKAVALALAAEGVNVAITGRNENNLKSVVAEIESKGVKSSYSVFDVTDKKQVFASLEKLQNDSLVYRFQDKNIIFVTYQEYRNLSFIDFKLKYDFLDDSITYLDDRVDLISAFPNEHELRALNRMSDLEQARIQIFKLLSQANLETLTEKNPNAKKDYFGYQFRNLETKESYPIYLFPENANFELVAIT